MNFTELLVPLQPVYLALAIVTGLSFGFVVRAYRHGPIPQHWFWMAASAVSFFVPTALLRELVESNAVIYERVLGTGIAYLVWILGFQIGIRLGRRHE